MINKLLNKMNYQTKLTILRIGLLINAIMSFYFGLFLLGVTK
ncbi:hypothetical protein [Aliarcobacter butzleri]|uniref:Uncharacterized protein n=1 Tax=Aliarcobacter butzleri L352 TaxID=1447260 RepID=A0A837JA99_9BACT|nr:hypothetical protein [Aliarcobacter butzleri]KLE03622.1 hypothetical protein AF77_09190 [Aliarcobacter butzleri L352]